ncbi:MYND-type zinc finger protein samB [Abortiporus biennis]
MLVNRPTVSTDTCTFCEKDTALRRCSRCFIALYCDERCQREGWRTHKSICRPPAQMIPALPPPDDVQGIRLLGGYNGPFRPEVVTVNPDYPVWKTGTVSPVSQLIGVPLLIHREVKELPLGPGSWICSPSKNIGPVTVVRPDQQPLTTVALEMIWMFCDSILGDFGDTRLPPLDRYNATAFETFCEDYRDQYLQFPSRFQDFQNLQLPI